MRILITLTAAALAATAVASSAFAESTIGCDSSIPLGATASADNCRAWGIVSPDQAAFAYVSPRSKMAAAPVRRHNPYKTDVHGGAGD